MAEIKQEIKKEKPTLRYLRDKDREPVKGIFRFYEVPGGCMSFSIKLYKEDQIENYTLVDNQVYTVPLGVAKHLNKNGCYPVHEYAQDENGKASQIIKTKVRRFGFHSLEFVDIDDLTPVGKPLVESVVNL